MNAFKRLQPRLDAWYRWHTNPTSIFDSGSNKFVAPAFFALAGAGLAAAICISHGWLWTLLPAVFLAALIGGAVGDISYVYTLICDIAIERELAARLKVIDDAVKETESIINHHAPELDSVRRYFTRVRARLAQINQVWYDDSIGAWCLRVQEYMGSEMAILVHILNKVHRLKQPDWKNLDVERHEDNHAHCDHPGGPVESRWCSFCYEEVYRQLATPLLETLPQKS